MSEYDLIAQGSYTSTAAAMTIELPSGFDYFEVFNDTDWGDTTAVTNIKSWWQYGMADDTGAAITQAVTTNALSSADVTSAGFTLITASTPMLGPLITNATSSATNADPIVVTLNSHGLSNGDMVLLQQTTGALQIAGIPWFINNVMTNTFDLPYTGQAPGDAATQVRAKKVLYPDLYTPSLRYITNVTVGATTEVEFSYTHGYSVGQQLRFSIPSEWAMVELDGLSGYVTAINTTTNTVTVDIDSSAFTAFDWPRSTVAAAGVSPATAQPIGETAAVFDGSFLANGYVGMRLGTNVVGASGKTMYWKAWKAGYRSN